MGEFGVTPPEDHQEAKDLLTMAYQNLFGPAEPNPFALGFAQAIGLMEGDYGRWGPNASSNNWGAITRQPSADGTCPIDSFVHVDSSFETGEYETCFRIWPTSLEGAEGFLTELFIRRPAVHEAAVNADYRAATEEMYATSYYTGTAPHEQRDDNGAFTNVNRYIAFIGKGIDEIADLYPFGPAPSDSNIGLLVGLAAAAGVVALVAAKS